MSMDISITLSDADLEHFVADIKAAEEKSQNQDQAAIVAAARKMLDGKSLDELPDFIRSRLARIRTMADMVEDKGFDLPEEERRHTLTALAYFADPSDAIPDNVAVLGYLDDAIMIELCVRELKFEVEAYEDFRDWRDAEARRRGEDPSRLALSKVDWAEARRVEAIQRMRHRRNTSYTSGSWRPTLFKVR